MRVILRHRRLQQQANNRLILHCRAANAESSRFKPLKNGITIKAINAKISFVTS